MADDAQESKSGGGKGLIIVLIVLVLVLIIAVIGGGWFLYSKTLGAGAHAPQPAHEETVAKPEANDKGEMFSADVPELTLNVTDTKGKEKFMKLAFSIKSTEKTIAAIVTKNKADIVDVVISMVSSRSSEELSTVGGKNLLKDELLQEINNVVNKVTETNKEVAKNNVKAILFTTFVIK